jgi:hypothetical protein
VRSIRAGVRWGRRLRDEERGFLTIQFVVAVALSFVLLTVVANLIVWQYARGAARAAVDEGVRTGSRATASVVDCEARARDVMSDLLGGALGDDVAISCQAAGDQITATADARLPSWLPLMPGWSFRLTASDVKEQEP